MWIVTGSASSIAPAAPPLTIVLRPAVRMAHRPHLHRHAPFVASSSTQGAMASSSTASSSAPKRVFTKPSGASYESVKTNGTGSFGVVYKAIDTATQEVVAIKRVLQDKRYKVRKFVCVSVMALLHSSWIIPTQSHFSMTFRILRALQRYHCLTWSLDWTW